MKKTFYRIGIFVLLINFFPTIVNANIICNDGTVSPSCTSCHRGCCSHHGGCSNGTSNPSYNDGTSGNNSSGNSNYGNSHPTIKEIPKSTDATLIKLIIDNKSIKISDNMTYSSISERAYVYPTTTDDKATIKYDPVVELVIGDNPISIKVIAENGNTKEYKLNIIREKVLSNNKNIKLFVDCAEITFDSYKSKTIYLSNEKDTIDINYELEDENATAEIIGNKNLKVGENEVIVRVTAENGEEQDYIITVNRRGKAKKTGRNSIFPIFVICGGTGGLIYCSIKKAREKQTF